MDGILDVEQDSVAGAGAGGEADGGVDGDVVALIGARGLPLLVIFSVSAAAGEAVQCTGASIDKYARAGDDLCVLRRGDRNLDYINAEERGVGVFVGLFTGAAGEFFGLAHERCAGDVDINVVLVVRIEDQSVGVRAAAGLHGGDLLGILAIFDVEDPTPPAAFLLPT